LEKKLEEALRDLKIEFLGKVTEEGNDTSFDDLWGELVLLYPDHLPLYMAKLKYLDENPKRLENLANVISVAKTIISCISEVELAQGLGRNADLQNGDSVQVCASLLEILLTGVLSFFSSDDF
jgi:hypothetical protein